MPDHLALRSKAAEMRTLAANMRRASDELAGIADLFDDIAERLGPGGRSSQPPPTPNSK